MSPRRVMMVGLDGFELSIAERMMAEGRLPAMQRLHQESALVLLDHGPAKRTGLAWEHVSSGLAPEAISRWSAIAFDPDNYGVRQMGAVTTPFPALLDRKCVVFDPPYFRLERAPDVRGITCWGAHDPGTTHQSRPASLIEEMEARFGRYPAEQWIYGWCWPSLDRSRRMAEDVPRAFEARTEHILWLFGERLPDWELGIVAAGEYHSAIESMWQGLDPEHPLHELPTAAACKNGIERVYEAGDRMIARLQERFADTDFVVFSMHGMGRNQADAIVMVLLPELLHRHFIGETGLGPSAWETTANGTPIITSNLAWEEEVGRIMDPALRDHSLADRIKGRIRRTLIPEEPSLDWMLATRYRRFWPRMRAFSLPSYYDGQIRLNIKGRERNGLVALENYEAACDEVETLLRECRDALTGDPVVGDIRRFGHPMERSPFQADLMVEWKGFPLGLTHPRLGQIGPIPYKRTGGHTGKTGVAWFRGEGLRPGHYGTRSAFDVVPTAIEMLGSGVPADLSGESLLKILRSEPLQVETA
jgi:predicted AlkP superfamily phosphohydrolase/phosphomutase